MRVYVRSKKTKVPVWIALPTGWLLNRAGAAILTRTLREQNISLERRDFLRLFKELKQLKKKHPRMELVDVKTAAGERVKIRL